MRLVRSLLILTTLLGVGCASAPEADAPPAELALPPGTPSKGRVLVVMSSASSITLADGTEHPTGYFLGELIHPVRAILDAGYEVTFATPGGVAPTLDRDSLHWLYWLGAGDERDAALRQVEASLKLAHPVALERVDLDRFCGMFLPGGHAPMVDLATNPAMGRALREMHLRGKPTGVLCHAPAALLAALPERDGTGSPWPYTGYRMAIFTSFEEGLSETFFLGADVPYYIDEALEAAGGDLVSCLPFDLSLAIRDRELVTGQNPYSAEAFGELFVQTLEEYRRRGTLRPVSQ